MIEGEHSPLLMAPIIEVREPSTFESTRPQNDEHLELQDEPLHAGNYESSKSSLSQVTVNMVKMCIGTGVLAIPFAANEGGLIFHILGTGLLFLWNYYSVQLLVQSEQYIQLNETEMFPFKHVESQSLDSATSKQNEPQSTFSRVAAEVFGSMGMHMIDCSMIFLMIGIVIAYEDAVLVFLEETAITTGSTRMDALCLMIIIAPLLRLPNYESASKISALGTGLTFAIFIVIGFYGIEANGFVGLRNVISPDGTRYGLVSMWPQSIASFSKWFGVVVFSNGIVPFTYELKESIEDPNLMMTATRRTSWIVFVAYSVIGCIISIIFVNGIQTDVISCLPHGYLPGIIRILMAIVVLTSLPLIIIPIGVLINSKVAAMVKVAGYSHVPNSAFTLRFIIASICAVISVEVPNFVYVISFIGCFCVAFISFVYPPLLHMASIRKFCSVEKRRSKIRLLVFDVILVVLGVMVVALTSVLTFISIIEQMGGSGNDVKE